MNTPPSGRPKPAPNGPLQVRDLLARFACYHQVLARYFQTLASVSADPLASFATLARWRHASVAANLEHHACEPHSRELEGWLREVPDGRVRELIDSPPEPRASLDEVVDYAFAVEAALERVYEQLQAHVQTPALHEMITNLTTLEHGVALRLNSARLELGYG